MTSCSVCVPPASGCACTQAFSYWSATPSSCDPTYAWLVDFGGGGVGTNGKTNGTYVRAVRGGL